MALYRSPHKNFRQKVRGELLTRHPVTGDVIDRKPTIAANFGVLGAEQTLINPETGAFTSVADIQGGFFDTFAAQEREGWSDDERQMVERKLDEIADTRPDYVQKVVPVHIAAPLPWQTYDELSPDEIVEFAPKLRLVQEALRYERENQNRAEITELLEVLLSEGGLSDPLPLSEIPAEQLRSMEPKGVQVQAPPRSTESGIPLDTPGFQMKPGTIIV